MITVHLHGAARQFGGPYRLAADTSAEVVRALVCQKRLPREFLRQADWKIIRGPQRRALREGRETGPEELDMGLGRHKELHLIPVAGGAKKAGIGKIILGTVLIAAAFVTGGASLTGAAFALGSFSVSASSLALTGLGMVLTGVSAVITQPPKSAKVSEREDSTQRVTSLFNGPINVAEMGNAIPLVYGLDVLAGSVVAAGSMTVEQEQLAPTGLPGEISG